MEHFYFTESLFLVLNFSFFFIYLNLKCLFLHLLHHDVFISLGLDPMIISIFNFLSFKLRISGIFSLLSLFPFVISDLNGFLSCLFIFNFFFCLLFRGLRHFILKCYIWHLCHELFLFTHWHSALLCKVNRSYLGQSLTWMPVLLLNNTFSYRWIALNLFCTRFLDHRNYIFTFRFWLFFFNLCFRLIFEIVFFILFFLKSLF